MVTNKHAICIQFSSFRCNIAIHSYLNHKSHLRTLKSSLSCLQVPQDFTAATKPLTWPSFHSDNQLFWQGRACGPYRGQSKDVLSCFFGHLRNVKEMKVQNLKPRALECLRTKTFLCALQQFCAISFFYYPPFIEEGI